MIPFTKIYFTAVNLFADSFRNFSCRIIREAAEWFAWWSGQMSCSSLFPSTSKHFLSQVAVVTMAPWRILAQEHFFFFSFCMMFSNALTRKTLISYLLYSKQFVSPEGKSLRGPALHRCHFTLSSLRAKFNEILWTLVAGFLAVLPGRKCYWTWQRIPRDLSLESWPLNSSQGFLEELRWRQSSCRAL